MAKQAVARESTRASMAAKSSSSAAAPHVPGPRVELVVTKSNAIIEANYRLTLQEQRVMLMCVGQIDSRSPLDQQRTFSIYAADFQNRYGLQRVKAYEELKEVGERLFERKLVINDAGNETRTAIRWVSAVRYSKGKGALTLHFSPEILPYLSQLRERFTTYSLSAIANLTSVFAIRLYELLAQYISIGRRSLTVEKLRQCLDCVTTFPRFSDFDRWAIQVAVDQINTHSDIRVSCHKRKQGRSVTALEFLFTRASRQVPKERYKVVKEPQETAEDTQRKWKETMLAYGIDPDDASHAQMKLSD